MCDLRRARQRGHVAEPGGLPPRQEGAPLAVAGVPPDYFSSKGQLWGNPLYDWDHLARTGYGWWIDRIRAAFELYDIIRLDHFRGFYNYWRYPPAPRCVRGKWRKGRACASSRR